MEEGGQVWWIIFFIFLRVSQDALQEEGWVFWIAFSSRCIYEHHTFQVASIGLQV